MFVKLCGKSEYISFGIWGGGGIGGIFVKWGFGGGVSMHVVGITTQDV